MAKQCTRNKIVNKTLVAYISSDLEALSPWLCDSPALKGLFGSTKRQITAGPLPAWGGTHELATSSGGLQEARSLCVTLHTPSCPTAGEGCGTQCPPHCPPRGNHHHHHHHLLLLGSAQPGPCSASVSGKLTKTTLETGFPFSFSRNVLSF